MSDHNRGRRRSDHAFNGERRRSRSPVTPRGFPGKKIDVPRLVDPFTITEHVSYDYFCNWYLALNPGTEVDSSMQAKYDDYTQDLLARTGKSFVTQNKDQPWFRDLYDGTDRTSIIRQAAFAAFQIGLDAGIYRNFSLAQSQPGDFSMDWKITTPLINEGDISTQVLAISNISSTIGRVVMQDFLSSHLPAFECLSLSRPERQDNSRSGWIVLKGDANSTEARTQINEAVLIGEAYGTYQFVASHYRRPAATARRRSLWVQLSDEAMLAQHLAQIEPILERIEAKFPRESLWPRIKSGCEDDVRRQVDLAVEYLRVVHAFDYWDMRQYDSAMDLETHSPQYSRPLNNTDLNQKAFEDWQATFDRKLHLYLNPTEHMQKLRVKSVAETVAETILSKVKKEDELRFRCQVLDCTKLFKDVPFVQKHIEKRHNEWVAQITLDAQLSTRYFSDPHKRLPYKEYRDPRIPRASSPSSSKMTPTMRRKDSRQQGRNGAAAAAFSGGAGFVSHRAGRSDYRGPGSQNYRDLDRPAEELPELNY